MIKLNAGVHYQNFTQIKLDHTMLLNAQRKRQSKLSTAKYKVCAKKTANLLQHISEEIIDLCVITETDDDDRRMGTTLMMFQGKGGGLALL